jgi:hypothetical protein
MKKLNTHKKLEIMEMYLLEDVIRFLQQEKMLEYRNIDQLVIFAQNEVMDPIRKRFAIISALRHLELYELGYNGAPFIPKERAKELTDIEILQFRQDKFVPAVYELHYFEVLNGLVRMDILLN